MIQFGIEDYYYIVALGIDKAENDLITLSIQTASTSSSSDNSSEQSSDYKIYSVDCESIDVGINILNNYLNKQINLSHCSAIVFSEEIAKESIKKYMYALGNNIEIRPTCNLIISSKSALDVLNKVANSGENFSSRLYEYILNSVDYTGYTIDATISNFLARMNSKQSQATAIYTIIGDDTIQNSGTAIFKDNIMVGVLTPQQTIAYLMLENDLKSCIIPIDNPSSNGDIINLELKAVKSSNVDVNLINHTPFITVKIEVEGDIASSGENFNYVSENNVEIVEQKANEYLENLIRNYLYTITKDYNSDISEFNEILKTKYFTENEFQKVHWNEIFEDSYFNVNVETNITATHLFNKE